MSLPRAPTCSAWSCSRSCWAPASARCAKPANPCSACSKHWAKRWWSSPRGSSGSHRSVCSSWWPPNCSRWPRSWRCWASSAGTLSLWWSGWFCTDLVSLSDLHDLIADFDDLWLFFPQVQFRWSSSWPRGSSRSRTSPRWVRCWRRRSEPVPARPRCQSRSAVWTAWALILAWPDSWFPWERPSTWTERHCTRPWPRCLSPSCGRFRCPLVTSSPWGRENPNRGETTRSPNLKMCLFQCNCHCRLDRCRRHSAGRFDYHGHGAGHRRAARRGRHDHHRRRLAAVSLFTIIIS